MRFLSFFIALLLVFSFPVLSPADVPATEFFALETTKLITLAPTDAQLETLSSVQLAESSIAHGWCDGSFRMKFDTATFRIDAQFDGAADFAGKGPAFISHHIDANQDHKSWSLFSIGGRAIKQGKQFVTADWRQQPITVVLRFLDLKH